MKSYVFWLKYEGGTYGTLAKLNEILLLLVQAWAYIFLGVLLSTQWLHYGTYSSVWGWHYVFSSYNAP